MRTDAKGNGGSRRVDRASIHDGAAISVVLTSFAQLHHSGRRTIAAPSDVDGHDSRQRWRHVATLTIRVQTMRGGAQFGHAAAAIVRYGKQREELRHRDKCGRTVQICKRAHHVLEFVYAFVQCDPLLETVNLTPRAQRQMGARGASD